MQDQGASIWVSGEVLFPGSQTAWRAGSLARGDHGGPTPKALLDAAWQGDLCSGPVLAGPLPAGSLMGSTVWDHSAGFCVGG